MLIVEDDELNLIYLKEIFVNTGIKTLNAFTGKETLKIIDENLDIDLVLMDIRLPDTNGLILTKIIRKSHPRIKIVAQTAYATSTDMQDCIDAGCHDYISKPINYQKLFSIIGSLLKD